MAIPIKIQCECGQRYAFEVESETISLPAPVTCPSCGADGTAAANEALARNRPAEATAPAAPGARPQVRIVTASAPKPVIALAASAPAVAPRRSAAPVREVDLTQAAHEARAKIFWGDPPQEVFNFLRLQGLGLQEASRLVRELSLERTKEIRANGIKKVVTGAAMACCPVVAWFGFLSIGFIPLKLFAFIIMFGLWGVWRVVKGAIMTIAPKLEPGDVAEQ